ncbi:MAG: class I SAM-dependent methyltransferase [Candidatus Aenigmarchaeota archaeon]|nr:class I SAM-dependent methyltransferase [Candidatus Aenigmarchaeota archaeon]
MQKKEDLKNTYNKIAEHFDATRQNIWKETGMLFEKLKENSLVLDLASGTGRHALYAKKKGHNCVCSDFSQKQILQARKKDRNMSCVLSDLLKSPFKKETFDAILYIAAIHHIKTEKERIESLDETKRVLKPNGLVLVSTWSLDAPKFKKEKITKKDVILTWDKKYPRYYHLFSSGELEELVKKSGLNVIKTKQTNSNFWVLAKKS